MSGMNSFLPTNCCPLQHSKERERDHSGYSEVWKWPVDLKFLKQKPLLASVLIHILVSACFFVAVREHQDQQQPGKINSSLQFIVIIKRIQGRSSR